MACFETCSQRAATAQSIVNHFGVIFDDERSHSSWKSTGGAVYFTLDRAIADYDSLEPTKVGETMYRLGLRTDIDGQAIRAQIELGDDFAEIRDSYPPRQDAWDLVMAAADQALRLAQAEILFVQNAAA